MAKVTSKYQVTIPKKIAEHHGIHPGDDIDWVAAGDVIRVIPSAKQVTPESRETRLRLFDQATERQSRRQSGCPPESANETGWSRDDLYGRGRSR